MRFAGSKISTITHLQTKAWMQRQHDWEKLWGQIISNSFFITLSIPSVHFSATAMQPAAAQVPFSPSHTSKTGPKCGSYKRWTSATVSRGSELLSKSPRKCQKGPRFAGRVLSLEDGECTVWLCKEEAGGGGQLEYLCSVCRMPLQANVYCACVCAPFYKLVSIYLY